MISEHVSLAVAALAQVDEPARERIARIRYRQGQHLRGRRQGKDSGRGPLHRRHEVGTPELDNLRGAHRLSTRLLLETEASISFPRPSIRCRAA